MNIQTLTSNVRSPVRRKTVSPFDPTDLGASSEGRQVLDRQLDAFGAAGCERIFEDHASGAAVERPNLGACLDYLREGDVLAVLDLGRRAGELIALVDELDQRGIGFRALNTLMDTTTPAGRAFLRIRSHARSEKGASAVAALGRTDDGLRMVAPEVD